MFDSDRIYIVQQYRCKIYVKFRLSNSAAYELEDQLQSPM